MISRDMYKMLNKINKKIKKGETISYEDESNIKYFPYIEGIIEDFKHHSIQYPLAEFVFKSPIGKYLSACDLSYSFTISEIGKVSIEKYRENRNKNLISYFSIILSVIAIGISFLALFK